MTTPAPRRLPSKNKHESPILAPIALPDDLINVFSPEIEHQSFRLVKQAVENITKQKAYFREAQIEKAALNAAQKKVEHIKVPDPDNAKGPPILLLEHPRFIDLIRALIKQVELVEVGKTGFLTTQEMYKQEEEILRIASKPTDDHVLSEAVVQGALDVDKRISEEQTAAVIAACRSNKLVTVIEGTAGAGKSFTMAAIKKAYQDAGYIVRGTALSWNAAKVLEASAKISNCEAIEGIVQSINKSREIGVSYFDRPTLLIVDEAGMVATKHMYKLLEEAEKSRHKVKIVLTGDSKQVMPVDAGNPLEAIVTLLGTTRINTIRRQKQESHRTAVYRFSERKAGQGLHVYMHQEALRWCQDRETQFNMVVQDYLSYRIAHPGKLSLVLALSNNDVTELNKRIRKALRKTGQIRGKEITVNVTDGRDKWEAPFAVGDQVVIRNNDRNMLVYDIDPNASTTNEKDWKVSRVGLFNRNAGQIVGMRRAKTPVGSWDLIIDLGGETPGRVVVNTETFKHPERKAFPVVHNFATTIYASQGQTVQKVFIIDNKRIEFRLAYVGMSRHTEAVNVYLNETDLHERIDQRRSKSRDKKVAIEQARRPVVFPPKTLDPETPIALNRYTRMEMLSEVAKSWGTNSRNLTATLFEILEKTGKLDERDPPTLTMLGHPYDDEPYKSVIDFIPENNKRIPSVDIRKLLDLPDPVEETEMVRPSTVDENAEKIGDEVPLRARFYGSMDVATLNKESVRKTTEQQGKGLFGQFVQQAKDWFLGDDVKSSSQEDNPLVLNPEGARKMDLPGGGRILPPGFKNEADYDRHCENEIKEGRRDPRLLHIRDYADFVEEDNIANFLEVMAKKAEKILGQIKGNDKSAPIPMLKEEPLCGSVCWKVPVDAEGNPSIEVPDYIDWSGVPGLTGEDGDKLTPSDDLIKRLHGRFWDAGRDNEPRILAMNPGREIMARYRLDGSCVVGEGYPPLIANPKANERTPLAIFAGPKEWLGMRERWEKTTLPKTNIPHMLWAAKDMDWMQIRSAIEDTPVEIYSFLGDSQQAAWAKEVRQWLKSEFNINARIRHIKPGEDVVASIEEEWKEEQARHAEAVRAKEAMVERMARETAPPAAASIAASSVAEVSEAKADIPTVDDALEVELDDSDMPLPETNEQSLEGLEDLLPPVVELDAAEVEAMFEDDGHQLSASVVTEADEPLASNVTQSTALSEPYYGHEEEDHPEFDDDLHDPHAVRTTLIEDTTIDEWQEDDGEAFEDEIHSNADAAFVLSNEEEQDLAELARYFESRHEHQQDERWMMEMILAEEREGLLLTTTPSRDEVWGEHAETAVVVPAEEIDAAFDAPAVEAPRRPRQRGMSP